jgi:hypothetical protein
VKNYQGTLSKLDIKKISKINKKVLFVKIMKKKEVVFGGLKYKQISTNFTIINVIILIYFLTKFNVIILIASFHLKLRDTVIYKNTIIIFLLHQ